MKSQKNIIQFIALIIIQLIIFIPISLSLQISNVQITDITGNTAKVTWETDDYATGIVNYGDSASLGKKERHTDYQKSHSIALDNLKSGTEYFVSVESTDVVGNRVVDNNIKTFTTLDTTPPDKVTGLSLTQSGKDFVKISWDTSTASDLDHYIIYRDNNKLKDTTTTSYHDTGLESGKEYSYKVSAIDKTGNEGQKSDSLPVTTTEVDTTDPKITGVKVSHITQTGAEVSWSTTEKSSSIVLYGTSENLGQEKKDTNLVQDHKISLTGLKKNETYYYKVRSCDSNDNCEESSIGKFSTDLSKTSGTDQQTDKKVETDTEPPFINISLPRYYNKRIIDIIGNVEAKSSVKLYVNDMNVPTRVLYGTKTVDSKFRFFNVALQHKNTIKIFAEDEAGNTNEATFNIELDLEEPVVNLKEIPSIITSTPFKIEGTVSEYVNMYVYLSSSQMQRPSKVTGLTVKSNNNSVELKWDEYTGEGFSHYVIYREDVGPIAITKPADYNSYQDLLVNKGKTYSYQVSAVNEHGKEGPKSSKFSILVMNGNTDIGPPKPINDVTDGVKKEAIVKNISGSFIEEIDLGEDGEYYLVLEFIDKVGNSVRFDHSITLDTVPPEIEIIKPADQSFVYENYANDIKIEGRTEPEAAIHLFMGRTPFGGFDANFDVSGLADNLANLDESELSSSCHAVLGQTSYCTTGADYSETAEDDGSFEFSGVDLTPIFGIGGSINQVPVTDTTHNNDPEAETKAHLLFIATDKAGHRASKVINYRIGTCWSGNFSWDITPLLHYQSPSTLSVERLRENTEQIFFYFNYTYVGRGKNGEIKDVSFTRACSDMDMVRDSRFNISCQILPPGAYSNSKINPEGLISYTSIRLNRIEGMQNWLGDDWDGFFDAVNDELTFPFKVTIHYEHEVDGRTISEYQTTCQEVTYVLDSSIVDPREVLPDWVLYDFVDFLNESINTINTVQEQLARIIEYTTIACIGSYVLKTAFQVVRRWTSLAAETKFRVNNFLGTELVPTSSEEDTYCKNVAKGIAQSLSLKGTKPEDIKDFTGIKLEYFSDEDLQKCFPSVASAWKTEEKFYKLQRWSCDRVFGHSSPAGWTKDQDDEQIYKVQESGLSCDIDQSVQGQRILARPCKDLAKQMGIESSVYTKDDKCFQIYVEPNAKAYHICVLDKRPVDEKYNLYKVGCYKQGSLVEFKYVVKDNNNLYLTARSETCPEICGEDGYQESIFFKEFEIEDLSNKNPEPLTPKQKAERDEDEKDIQVYPTQGRCLTATQCRDLSVKFSKQTGTEITMDRVKSFGFTSDCFYGVDKIKGEKISNNPLLNTQVVSTDPNQRRECCCINAVKSRPTTYYQKDDDLKYIVETEQNPNKKPKKAFPKKDSEYGFAPVEKWEEMDWSYRYWKEDFNTVSSETNAVHTEYNPYRYIKGRDFPACFGLNHLLDYAGSNKGNNRIVTLDPAKQHIAAFQCIHLSGIYNRLQMIKNIMSALSSCLITVRVSGTSDTGVCKELFTQYVCSLIWYFIQLVTDGCSPFGFEFEKDFPGDSIGDVVKRGFKSVWGSIADSQAELAEEYGNAKLNNLLGQGEEGLARKICLGAFGYDWELNLQDIIDASYASPYATLVQAITGTREYLTIDPTTQRAKYEYRASWLINPGCDLRDYRVYLSCVSSNEMDKYPGIDCGAVNDPAGWNCDCLQKENEIVTPFFSEGGNFAQSTLIDTNHHDIITNQYRFDHLKFKLYLDQDIDSDLHEDCFPEGHEDGVFYFPLRDKTIQDLVTCTVDASQGQFICQPPIDFWTAKGRAVLNEIFVNSEKFKKGDDISVYEGQALTIEPNIRKLQGAPVCLVVEVDKYGVRDSYATLIDAPGDYNQKMVLEEQIRLGQSRGTRGPFSGDANPMPKDYPGDDDEKKRYELALKRSYVEFRTLQATNTADETIILEFFDLKGYGGRGTKDGKINLDKNSEDQVSINGGLKKDLGSYWDESKNTIILNFTVDSTKEVIKTKITKVDWPQNFGTKIHSIKYNLPIAHVRDKEQTWTLIVSLQEVREGDLKCSYPTDEIIKYQGQKQQKEIDLRVKDKESEDPLVPEVNIEVAPEIDFSKHKELHVTITASDKESEIYSVDTEVLHPLGIEKSWILKKEKNTLECDPSEDKGDNKYYVDCQFTIGKGEFNIAGDYTIEATVKDNDEIEKEATDKKIVSVLCYDGGGSSGKCEKDKCPDDSRTLIPEPVLRCADEYVCCNYYYDGADEVKSESQTDEKDTKVQSASEEGDIPNPGEGNWNEKTINVKLDDGTTGDLEYKFKYNNEYYYFYSSSRSSDQYDVCKEQNKKMYCLSKVFATSTSESKYQIDLSQDPNKQEAWDPPNDDQILKNLNKFQNIVINYFEQAKST